MFLYRKEMKLSGPLLAILILCLFLCNCDLNIFKPNQGPEIDSLYVDEPYEYVLGDTVHIVCNAHDHENDNITYQWYSDKGVIIPNGSEAKVVSDVDSILTVYCQLTDDNGNKCIGSVIVNFSNKYIIQGSLFGISHTQVCPLANQDFSITYYDKTHQYSSLEDGSFILEFESLPRHFNITFENNDYKLDTYISTDSLEQINSNRFEKLIIYAPAYEEYFPLHVNDMWVFDSYQSYGDAINFKVQGEETWQILDIDPNRDSLTMKIDFIGESYVVNYYENTRSFLDSVNTSVVIRLNKNTYWYFNSYVSGTTTTPGLALIKKYYLPYRFLYSSDSDSIHYGTKSWNRIYWEYEYGIGPTYGYHCDGDGMTWSEFFIIELLSFFPGDEE